VLGCTAGLTTALQLLKRNKVEVRLHQRFRRVSWWVFFVETRQWERRANFPIWLLYWQLPCG